MIEGIAKSITSQMLPIKLQKRSLDSFLIFYFVQNHNFSTDTHVNDNDLTILIVNLHFENLQIFYKQNAFNVTLG